MKNKDIELKITYPIIFVLCFLAAIFVERVEDLYMIMAFSAITLIVYLTKLFGDND